MNNYVIIPDTDIELLILNLQLDNKNQLRFKTLGEQNTYFNSLDSYTIENSTFQRNDYTVRIPLPFEDAIKYTYCRYKNKEKFYYAFLTDITYINSNMTSARLVTDVWQTYQFDITIKTSFIERETTASDIAGQYTYPEELESGDYISNQVTILGNYNYDFTDANNPYYICVETTIDPTNGYDVTVGVSGGLPTSYGQYVYRCNNDGLQKLQTDIKNIISKGGVNREQAILNVYLVHPLALGSDGTREYQNGDFIVTNTPFIKSFTIENFTKLYDYTPINKKLLTYPFCYFEVTNGGNGINILKPEQCNMNTPSWGTLNLNTYGLVVAGNSVKLIPSSYGGNNDTNQNYIGNIQESLSLAKLPLLSWATDPYIAWLVNNTLNQDFRELRQNVKTAMSLFNDGVNTVSNTVTNPLSLAGGVSNTGANLVSNLTEGMIIEQENMRERYLHDLEPAVVRGTTDSADVLTSIGSINFYVRKMSIKPEYAKKLDGYFYKYGYKINETKPVILDTREKFNYIKTVGVIITGDVPQIYMETIKSMFNNGVTLWHNPNTFMSYSSTFNDNPIKSSG